MKIKEVVLSFFTTVGAIAIIETFLFFLGTLLMHTGSDGLALFGVFLWPLLVGPTYSIIVFGALWFICHLVVHKVYFKT